LASHSRPVRQTCTVKGIQVWTRACIQPNVGSRKQEYRCRDFPGRRHPRGSSAGVTAEQDAVETSPVILAAWLGPWRTRCAALSNPSRGRPAAPVPDAGGPQVLRPVPAMASGARRRGPRGECRRRNPLLPAAPIAGTSLASRGRAERRSELRPGLPYPRRPTRPATFQPRLASSRSGLRAKPAIGEPHGVEPGEQWRRDVEAW
jgi:hypothetical protein